MVGNHSKRQENQEQNSTDTHFCAPSCPPNEEGEQTNTVKEDLNTSGTMFSGKLEGHSADLGLGLALVTTACSVMVWLQAMKENRRHFWRQRKLCVWGGGLRDMRTERFVSMPHNKDLILIRPSNKSDWSSSLVFWPWTPCLSTHLLLKACWNLHRLFLCSGQVGRPVHFWPLPMYIGVGSPDRNFTLRPLVLLLWSVSPSQVEEEDGAQEQVWFCDSRLLHPTSLLMRGRHRMKKFTQFWRCAREDSMSNRTLQNPQQLDPKPPTMPSLSSGGSHFQHRHHYFLKICRMCFESVLKVARFPHTENWMGAKTQAWHLLHREQVIPYQCSQKS